MTGTTADPAYYAPDTVETARRRVDETDGSAVVVAGGQTLLPLLRQGEIEADALVDVGDVPALSGISLADRASVGPTTTYADLAGHEVSDRAAMLGDACAVIGDRQVRNMGTVGGAVCLGEPSFDLLAPLLCLDAEVTVGSVDGRRTLPLADFLCGHARTDLGDDELLERIAVDIPGGDTGTAYEKHSTIEAGWAAVGAAATVTVADGRIADARVGLTAVADTAVRAPSVEAALADRPASDSAVADASVAVTDDIDPVDDHSGSAAYKRQVAPTLVERSLSTAIDRAGGDR